MHFVKLAQIMLNFIFWIENFILEDRLLVDCSRSCYSFGGWFDEDFGLCGGFVVGVLKGDG